MDGRSIDQTCTERGQAGGLSQQKSIVLVSIQRASENRCACELLVLLLLAQ